MTFNSLPTKKKVEEEAPGGSVTQLAERISKVGATKPKREVVDPSDAGAGVVETNWPDRDPATQVMEPVENKTAPKRKKNKRRRAPTPYTSELHLTAIRPEEYAWWYAQRDELDQKHHGEMLKMLIDCYIENNPDSLKREDVDPEEWV